MSVVMESCSTNGCGMERTICKAVKPIPNFSEIVKMNSTERTDNSSSISPNGKLRNGYTDANSLSPSAEIEASASTRTIAKILINGFSDETSAKQGIQNEIDLSSDSSVGNIGMSSESQCKDPLKINGLHNLSESAHYDSDKSSCVKQNLSPNFRSECTEDELVFRKIDSVCHANEHSFTILAKESLEGETSLKIQASEPSCRRKEGARADSSADSSELTTQTPTLDRRLSSRPESSSDKVSSVIAVRPSTSTVQQLDDEVALSTSASATSMLVLPDGRPVMITRTGENPTTTAKRELVRPVAKLLQDTGLLLASEQVFKNLAKLQRNKVKRDNVPAADSQSCGGPAVAASERRLLEKLNSSYSTLASRNADFAIPFFKRCYCGFQTESSNVLRLHQLCGKVAPDGGPSRCCMCEGKFSYRARAQFERHIGVVHRQKLHSFERPASYSCDLCPTDLGSQSLMKLHEKVCKKRFVSVKNLSPHVNDEDIPLRPRVLQKTVVPPSSSDVKIFLNLPDKPQVNSSIVLVNKQPATTIGSAGLLPSVKPIVQISAYRKPSVMNLTTIKSNAQTLLRSASSNIKVTNADRLISNVKTERLPVAVCKVLPSPSDDRTKKPKAGCVICPACSGFVRDEAALEIHMRVVHSLLSATEMTVCWMCHERSPIAVHQLLSHLADKHGVTLKSMLQLRQCSLCSTVPKMRNASAFEVHMLSAHPTLFVSAEALWQIIEGLTQRRHRVRLAPDGTLQCKLCGSNFISRSFLCRHAFMAHGGSFCDCDECEGVAASAGSPSAAVVISDEEDGTSNPKRMKLVTDSSGQFSTGSPIEQLLSIKRKRCFQDLIAEDGSLMDKVEEILEIDGETVLIVQEADFDDDDEDC